MIFVSISFKNISLHSVASFVGVGVLQSRAAYIFSEPHLMRLIIKGSL